MEALVSLATGPPDTTSDKKVGERQMSFKTSIHYEGDGKDMQLEIFTEGEHAMYGTALDAIKKANNGEGPKPISIVFDRDAAL